MEHHRAVQAARVAAWKVSLGQQEGEAGMAGGGAGYYGGTAGEKIVHHHTNDCYRNASIHQHSGDWEYFMWGSNCFDSSGTNSYQYNGHTTSTDDDEWSRAIVRSDGPETGIILRNRCGMFPVIGDSHQWQYDIESFIFLRWMGISGWKYCEYRLAAG